MKKLILIVLVLGPLFSMAQSDTTYWNKGGSVGINANQASLTNWSAGGVNSYAGGAYFYQFFDYKKESIVWTSTIDMGFGFIKEAQADAQKADDRLVLTSQVGKKIGSSEKWYYSGMLDFRTQFAYGYDADAPDDSDYISKFMAPGYLLASVGVDYRPTDYFHVAIGPLASKMTFVMDQRLADLGSFGVEGATLDTNGNLVEGTGNQFRGEFGATLTASFNKEIFKNTTFVSNLILFTNYLDNPEKIDVNWENILTLKVNDFLSAMVYLQTIYDYDIKFYDLDANGEQILSTETDKWQFKSIIGIGLGYTFGGTRG
ncbi:hypothetical protein BFP72_14490 [Reichenbachiella sp. 5M10]|uniref:DUF3078 domain-containing protein n=1 Tax=Reichenbachiella sp. 5M10 TaxID=1889772 RepID=UPI000C15A757|nr:DUF3078 domain-containing protein [Reichenbachiella sp. 5M10]PIB36521.1 hypothetical protein BFP72_14490 [Reichenbachiella sp. 5M10]